MNDPERFEVIFHGEMVRKNELLDIKHQMRAMFQLDADRVEALFTGQPLVIKRNLTKELAEKYKRAIAQTGGFSIVVAQTPQPQTITPDEADQESPADPHMITAQIAICPACLHKQLAADQCNRCNVHMEKFAIAIRLRKERERMRQLLSNRKKTEPHGEAWREDLAEALREQQSESLSKARKNVTPLAGTGAKRSLLSEVRRLISGNTSRPSENGDRAGPHRRGQT